jgi:hypothetical protein
VRKLNEHKADLRRILRMAIIGYIVQHSNEDDYTVYHGSMKLFRVFSEAVDHANDLYRGYMEKDPHEQFDGPFNIRKPTKKECDAQGSVVVFESRNYIVWIDCVVD